ncbi:MAG: hypothetical protein EOP54_05105 [Sphingobacteriales bacterium]|nr:MAG: hypothetical protein EOP54_05105 [Sphingobacteriales bacterium]
MQLNIRSIFLTLLLLLAITSVGYSQQVAGRTDSSKTAFIEILESKYTDIIKIGNENVTKIVGNVKLRSGTDILYCDSAVLYQDRKIAEAFGNVSIEQADGTTAFADYLKYTGGSKLVYMKGDVVLSDPKGNTLWSEEVDYNLSSKVGKYYKDGTLQNEQTILSSRQGEYNLKTKEARFKGDVVVNDPEYKATSEELGYNTDTRFVRFFADAIVQNETSTLFAKPGSTYDAVKKQAVFKGRSNIIHESQFIEGDDMKYNQISGWAIAKGNVVAIDTAEKATVWGGLLTYNELTGKMMVTDKPVLRRAGEEDTVYMVGDTVFSEPIANLERPDRGPVDTSKLYMDQLIERMQQGIEVDSTKIPLQNDTARNITDTTGKITTLKDTLPAIDSLAINDKDDLDTVKPVLEFPDEAALPALADDDPQRTDSSAVVAIDTAATDLADSSGTDRAQRPKNTIGKNPGAKIYDKSEAAKGDEENKPRYFLVYHNARVFSDSAQAKCDSLRYSQSDSLMILYRDPVVWGKEAQILGDTIYALLDSNKIHEVYVPKNAILIQQNGPEQAGMFDQVQGNRLHAFFVNNELDSALAYPNAETIYFSTDEDSAYLGASKASSERLKMRFKERKIWQVHYLKDFKQVMTPMKDAVPASFRLSRFRWRAAEKAKDLEAFLEGIPEARKKLVLGPKYKVPESELTAPEAAAKPTPAKTPAKKGKKKR